MATITIKARSNIKLVRRNNEKLRAKTPEIAKVRFKEAAQEIKRRMSKPGRKMTYPVLWDSDKQRLFVIISLRKKRKLPYKRTHAHRKSFQVVAIKQGYKVVTNLRGSTYIYGNARGQKQSRIHRGRHPHLRTETDAVLKKLPKAMRDSMVQLAKRLDNR